MPLPNTRADYSDLGADRAAALLGVMDRHAAWDSLRRTPTGDGRVAVARLQKLQRLFGEYQVALGRYATRYRPASVPAVAPGRLDRLLTWAAVARLVMAQAGDVACPTAIVARAHELCGQLAETGGWEPALRAETVTAADALREMDTILRWCDLRADPQPRPPRP